GPKPVVPTVAPAVAQSGPMTPVTPVMPVAVKPTVDPKAAGRSMLDKAHLELRNGQCEAARKLAEEVFAGPYRMQGQAQPELRSVDVEERNQKTGAANRAYDAAVAAFATGDYNQAIAVFLQIDGSLLPADRRAMMKEKMQIAGGMAQAPRMPGKPDP